MYAALDIGNSALKLALYQEGVRVYAIRWDNFLPDDWKKLAAEYGVQRAIVSSVGRPLGAEAIRTLAQLPQGVLTLDYNTPLPIRIHYRTPHTLGKDRIAAAVGAAAYLPQQTVLVIDAGTCITYEIVTAPADYQGGAISPGIRMRLQAMHHFTQRLPLVEKQRLDSTVGYSTESSISIGAVLGAALEVEGFIAHYTQLYGSLTCLLTGGDAATLLPHLRTPVVHQPDIVLFGLYKILEYNAIPTG